MYHDVVEWDGATSWVKPKNYEIKIMVDTVTFTKFSKYEIGMHAREEKGEVLRKRSEVYRVTIRPNFYDSVTVKEALSWVKENE